MDTSTLMIMTRTVNSAQSLIAVEERGPRVIVDVVFVQQSLHFLIVQLVSHANLVAFLIESKIGVFSRATRFVSCNEQICTKGNQHDEGEKQNERKPIG
mgnify:CR=1 FL=1